MITDLIFEIMIAIGKLFINPVLYIAIFVAILLGYYRVKRERKFFHIRLLWGWSEAIGLLKEGFLFAVILSFLSIVLGLTLPVDLLIILTVVSCVTLIIYVFHLLSPIILIMVSFSVLWLIEYFNWSFTVVGPRIDGAGINEGAVVPATILAGLLLVAEGLLIRKRGAQFASPIVEHSKRGLKAVAFFSKKLWILPIFVVIPGNVIDAYFPWWPQFSLGTTQFSFVVFPFGVAFQQLTRNTLPIHYFPRLGRKVLILGELVIIGGLVAYFFPEIGIFVLIIGAIARLGIAIYSASRQTKDVYAVSAKSSGVMIAGVLPNSPAEKMGLGIGEIIRKVNGIEVHTENELYEALQINAAHCRLEVLNHQNELRLTQHVVHNEDHYQIGLLIAE
ncbi:PDZ domain-containing protein [Lysinibacillus antri]|uniref:PDZ domain-containing protein n=1 Tax=Lysinibacillus antri TaxID=2498145 RepID=A0A3S0WH84_9BACI|nr:PDZ domain-containing protein [Lysinibacillus antri]RUL54242.1 PDZ domain-containing protein [Lysinibacillus antri]